MVSISDRIIKNNSERQRYYDAEGNIHESPLPESFPFLLNYTPLEDKSYLKIVYAGYRYPLNSYCSFREPAVAVKVDTYPLIWILWWFLIRLEITLDILVKALVFILEAWGLAYIPLGNRASLRCIGKRKE